MEKMAKYAEYFKRSHGDDVDFLKEPLDVAVAYDAGGGLPHGRIGLGDGYVDREAYSRRRSSSASSSRSQSTAETNELKEQLRRTQEQMQQMQQQMQYLMMAQFLAGGSTGSQFGMPQQSQGSESGQAYIPPPQGFMVMLGASRSGGQASTGVLPQMPPFGPWWQTPPAPFPPPAAGSRQGTPDGDIFFNLSGGGTSGGGASGGGSNHDMAMD
ncbi:hypothetical protein PVAP13_8KG223501 [Panicum virgatum]|uniref:Uncharacterized protein n=1 Tax=Panicum virgatum TaxID=38727 RepID=A0A8T0PMU8_PANVG|nr:hypothetical protein PVAP13_8KG223501 [Panicum virgatum]